MPLDTDRVEELTTPPRTGPRRVVTALVGLALAGLAIAGWITGAFLPDLRVQSAGGRWDEARVQGERVLDLETELRFQVENRGRFTVMLEQVHPPDTEGIEWQVDDALPARLPPGEQLEFALVASIHDCASVDAHGAKQLEFTGRGPLAPNLTASADVATPPATPDWLTTSPTDPPAQREASWIYHALAWPCDPEVVREAVS